MFKIPFWNNVRQEGIHLAKWYLPSEKGRDRVNRSLNLSHLSSPLQYCIDVSYKRVYTPVDFVYYFIGLSRPWLSLLTCLVKWLVVTSSTTQFVAFVPSHECQDEGCCPWPLFSTGKQLIPVQPFGYLSHKSGPMNDWFSIELPN